MNQLVSVIIPTYNRSSSLLKAIQSVLIQSYTYFEIIIVDDASTDDTHEVIAGILDSRIKYWRLEKNHGAAAARNYGVRQAKGEVIAFLDSDDIFLPEKLAHQLRFLNQYPIVVTGSILVLPSGKKINFIPPLSSKQGASLLGCRLCPGSTMMCRKQLLLDFPFDETLQRYEDWDWFIRQYLLGNNFYVLKLMLSKVYLRDTRPLTQMTSSLYALKEKYYFLDGYKKRYLLSGIFFEKAASFFWKKKYIRAINSIIISILLCSYNVWFLLEILWRKRKK